MQCWIAPRNIPPGADWTNSILTAIDNCQLFILLISDASTESKHVSRETRRAQCLGKELLELCLPENGETSEHWLDEAAIKTGKSLLSKRKKHTLFTTAIGSLVLLGISLVLIIPHPKSNHKPTWPETMNFVSIPAGTYLMGSPNGEQDRYSAEGPVREVHVDGFEMMSTEVTQAMWEDVTGESQETVFRMINRENPDSPIPSPGDNLPMVYISWTDAIEFTEALCALDPEYTYRLPAEAEWEYACRAGTEEARYSSQIDSIAWHLDNTDGALMPVGLLEPNAWGLHDMLGNASEWCLDNWHDNYTGAPGTGIEWTGGEPGYRVLRGASWASAPMLHRCAFRDRKREDTRLWTIGFRVVRVPTGEQDLIQP